MIIACATDRNYVELAGVLISSIAHNGNVPEARIVVCDYDLRDSDRRNLEGCAPGHRIGFIRLDGELRRQVAGLPQTIHWSRAMYSRLLLPDLLPSEDGRVLYLDSDMLVLGDLGPLFETPLDGKVLGAVADAAGPEHIARMNANLGRPADTPYFNSGALLIDIAAWKGRGAGGACMRFLQGPAPKLYPDQDALNTVLERDWLPIDRCWNFTGGMNEPLEYFQRAKILHFIGRKPHMASCPHPARDLYLRQRQLTPWANRPLLSNMGRAVQKARRWASLALERVGGR
jgi:lipopolysaccharide biosynthesis glycosyltransferase